MDFLEKYSTKNLIKKVDIINTAQRHNQFLSDAVGEHLDDISTSIEKQKKLNELFNSQYRIEETLWIFRLIIKESHDYRKVEKSSCLIKILTKNLNSSNSLWNKIFKITNSECRCKDFGNLLNIRIVRQTVFSIVITYFKSLMAYDGHYCISEALVEDKSRVKLLKSFDFSNMLGFLYFLMNYKDDVSDTMSKFMAELDPEFIRYLHKSFRNLSL